jgi:hypothetical protein
MRSQTSLFPRVLRLMRRRSADREAQQHRKPAARPPTAAVPASSTDEQSLDALEAEARHHRARLDLYRARVYALKPTSLTRLRELERTAASADARLAHARKRAPDERPAPR